MYIDYYMKLGTMRFEEYPLDNLYFIHRTGEDGVFLGGVPSLLPSLLSMLISCTHDQHVNVRVDDRTAEL